MFNRLVPIGLLSILVLILAACGPAPSPPPAAEEAAPPPAAAPAPPVHELTEVNIVETMPDFTSRNVSILGVKLGDVTRTAEANLGPLANTRTVPEYYITAYQDGGVVIHTFALTGRARHIEVTALMANRIQDPRLRQLLERGELTLMREIFGEEASVEELPDDNAVEYVYPNRGIRFVRYSLPGRTVHAIRFSET